MTLLVGVLHGSWALIEAEHPDTDLLELSFRKLLNVAYSWLRHHTSNEDWDKHYASVFHVDPRVQELAERRRRRSQPVRPGDRATIEVKRKAPPVPADVAMGFKSAGDEES